MLQLAAAVPEDAKGFFARNARDLVNRQAPRFQRSVSLPPRLEMCQLADLVSTKLGDPPHQAKR